MGELIVEDSYCSACGEEDHEKLAFTEAEYRQSEKDGDIERASYYYSAWAIGMVGRIYDWVQNLLKRVERLEQESKKTNQPLSHERLKHYAVSLLQEHNQEEYEFTKRVLPILVGPETAAKICSSAEATYAKKIKKGDTRDIKRVASTKSPRNIIEG